MGDRLGRALVTLHVKNLSSVWVDWLSDFSFFLSY
jgi:STE24 endopeptidase